MKSFLKRTAIVAGVTIAVLSAAIGYLHTPQGRALPIARKVMSLFGIQCPVNAISASRVEASHQIGMKALEGTRVASTRPALGLSLGETTVEEVRDWGALRGIVCDDNLRGLRSLSCHNVQPRLIGDQVGQTPIEVLTFTFNPHGRLEGVDIFRRRISPREAAAVMEALSHRLGHLLGKPSRVLGESTAKYLGEALHTSSTQYRFRNYVAMVSATNLPWSGVALHEQYLAGR